MDGVVVHQGDSTKLEPAKLRELAGGDIRIFSVDGGHTDEVVDSEMMLGEASSEFAGHKVVLVAPQGPKDILRKTAPARTLCHSRYRRMVRGLQVVSGGTGKVTGE
jgi:hypothetical protein